MCVCVWFALVLVIDFVVVVVVCMPSFSLVQSPFKKTHQPGSCCCYCCCCFVVVVVVISDFLSCIGDIIFAAKYFNQLRFIVINVALHNIHAGTE